MAHNVLKIGGIRSIGMANKVATVAKVEEVAVNKNATYDLTDLNKYDINDDGYIDIVDVTKLISYILNNDTDSCTAEEKARIVENFGSPDIKVISTMTTHILNGVCDIEVGATEETTTITDKTNPVKLDISQLTYLVGGTTSVILASSEKKENVIVFNTDGTFNCYYD